MNGCVELMRIILHKRHWKKEVQPETKSHWTTKPHSLHQSVQTDVFIHISTCVYLHVMYIRMACPRVLTIGHTKSFDLIIMLGDSQLFKD